MAESATDYQHGEMDVSEHAESYRLFGNLAKWGSLAIAVVILMLTLWFCVGVAFLGGLVPGIALLAIGVWFLRSKVIHDF
jgi:hypothetical protein